MIVPAASDRLPDGRAPARTAATVAFLFTDVEGSTALWEADAEGARRAIERQEAVVRAAVEAHGGHVFKVVGDGSCAAFADAGDAVHAALSAQLELAGAEERLRLRMAVHAGAAEAVGSDWSGPALNRVARVLAAAHGGQVLLSGAAAELVRGRLPEGAALRDLGEHLLPGLREGLRLFQLLHPGLPSRFPSLRAAAARPRHNLPPAPDPLVGRERELDAVAALLRGGKRLVTLTGTGGAGKTRLALAAAGELLEHFADGITLVELAAVTDPALVVPSIARALNLPGRGGRDPDEELRDHLRERDAMLVLDNLEQVLDAAPAVAALLAACPRLQVLATSRAPLRLTFETEFPVEPLEVADPDRLPPLDRLARVPAVALFLRRATAARPSFSLTPANAREVATVCSRLDGLPLAIELAAARMRLLPPRELLERLGRSLDVLAGGPRDRPPRHQTLRQAIDWSYRLLEPDARRLLCRLSVFAGGFTAEAAEAVCGEPGSEREVLEGLSTLMDLGLLHRTAGDDGRLTLLETIRAFARERLEASSEDPRPAHGRWCLELAETAERELRGAAQTAWVRRLDAEHENLRAALRWGLDAGEPELALRLATALWRYWELRGDISEGRGWLERALNAPGAAALDPALRARALCNAASLAKRQADLESAERMLERAVALAREAGDRWALAAALNLQGMVAYERLDVRRALPLYEESLALFRELDDRRAEAYALGNQGLALAMLDRRAAVAALRESLALFRSVGDVRGLAGALNNLGDALERVGEREAARTAHEESLALKRQLGSRHGVADSLANLASLALDAGEDDRAEALYAEAVQLYLSTGVRRGLVACLAGLSALAVSRGEPVRGARLIGRARRLSDEVGLVLPASERLERTEAAARAALGDDAFRAELERGAGVPAEDLLDAAAPAPGPPRD